MTDTRFRVDAAPARTPSRSRSAHPLHTVSRPAGVFVTYNSERHLQRLFPGVPAGRRRGPHWVGPEAAPRLRGERSVPARARGRALVVLAIRLRRKGHRLGDATAGF